MWTRHDNYQKVIEDGWQVGDVDLSGLQTALGQVQANLSKWCREEFGSVNKQLKVMREKLEILRSVSISTGPSRAEKELMNKISELLSREDIMMRKRSRALWLSEGGRNTKYFHAKVKERTRSNKIVSLQKDDGTYTSTQSELENLAANFYTSLFTAQDHTTPKVITSYVPQKVTQEMNDELRAPFTDWEIEKALLMMNPNKSPGPDGFTVGFYIKHWDLLKQSICGAIRKFLEGGDMPEIVNSTVLVLIPKIKQPQDLSQYQPIALCSILYKIVSKVLALVETGAGGDYLGGAECIRPWSIDYRQCHYGLRKYSLFEEEER
jgi:hypothetical protein